MKISKSQLILLSALAISCSGAPDKGGKKGSQAPDGGSIGGGGDRPGGDQGTGDGTGTGGGGGGGGGGVDTGLPNTGIPQSCNIPAPKAPVVQAPEAGKMIRTVAAGRPRLRHESNGDYAFFGNNYFEHRSFEFTIDDYTPTGDKRIVVTLKPLGIHGTGNGDNGLPNFRVFQNGGTNPDLFNGNHTMKDNGDNTFTFEIKDGGNNPQTALTEGRLIGFEFGFFFNPMQVPGQTNYYSDTFRFQVGKQGMVVGVPLTQGVAGNPELLAPKEALSAGDHTIPLISDPKGHALYFSQNTYNITGKDMQAFLEGRSLFHSNFVTGKHTENGINFSPERIAKQANLAGPALDAPACSKCHVHNASFSVDEKERPDHVIKIANTDGSVHKEFGLQLQKSELAKATALKVETITKEVELGDGTKVTLTAPKYSMPGTVLSPRIPQMVYGLGLLEAVSAENIASRVPCEAPAAGISGKMAEVTDPKTGAKSLGRFGWKAGKVSLEHQVSEAALFDLGVSNPMFPTDKYEQTGVNGMGTPEIPQEDINRMVAYMRNIAVPVQRNTTDPKYISGQKVFQKLACSSCHVPEMYTDDKHPVEKLRNQIFKPYTDLLLHDMGEGLADGKTENNASGSEWRTPPLWGLGLMKTVNGELRLLHDGRAKSFEEAILWHGGEAAAMQAAFTKLPKAERDDLIFFLDSI